MSLEKAADTLDNSLNSLEKIKEEIKNCTAMYDKALKDNRKLSEGNSDTLKLAGEFYQRSQKLNQDLQMEEEEQGQRTDDLKKRLSLVKKEESRLKEEEKRMKEEHRQIDQMERQLRQQTEVSAAMPEKKVVFAGNLNTERETFNLESEIVYPMEGGTALITFEDEEAAQNILSMKEHDVPVGDFSITLEAKPVQFIIPSLVEMDTYVCPNRVLVSNLPKNMNEDDESRLLDRLEVHFSKTRNGGGEVESICMLQDSGNVVIAFTKDNVARGLVGREYHEIDVLKKKHKVRVTPFINGEIKDLQVTVSVSSRTVLLTGIPDVTEEDTMQDCLEIHFQKSSSGGGEVDAIVFNPMGQRKLAVFRDDSAARPHTPLNH
ncbi:interferon-induced 35 kDa protein homolog [Scleropages formosus]|uniref:Interferon-induced 35 kDa protein homolog n=1 Tax=Scleropages formosus TaxID=113540 RepID=A0A8C9U866_SCLFO|nr:interferon-induced 35 kDa protein homolog [Scleropages formosus]